mmetsp:Transcript_63066/g.173057  ORF Transcript_63066/g.173057 Transcript_63066/m.173057 type:complete len:203 (+) Transcript_63066:842-1450(+)
MITMAYSRSTSFRGRISPYPTVVIVVNAQYSPAKYCSQLYLPVLSSSAQNWNGRVAFTADIYVNAVFLTPSLSEPSQGLPLRSYHHSMPSSSVATKGFHAFHRQPIICATKARMPLILNAFFTLMSRSWITSGIARRVSLSSRTSLSSRISRTSLISDAPDPDESPPPASSTIPSSPRLSPSPRMCIHGRLDARSTANHVLQ